MKSLGLVVAVALLLVADACPGAQAQDVRDCDPEQFWHQPETLRECLNAGRVDPHARIDYQETLGLGHGGQTLLQIAVWNNDPRAVELLLDAGADPMG